MANFSFDTLEVPADKVIPYTFHQIDEEKKPVLKVVQATESNKPYWSGVLRRNSAVARRIRGGRLTPAMLDETRESDRELFAKFVVKAWDHVVDSDTGELVPFSPVDCLGFLRALPNWIFDDFRNFAADIQNFLDEDVPDEEATSGN